MAQRRHHYEAAFEELLRARRIPYVAVDESRKALLPIAPPHTPPAPSPSEPDSLKSFDFVVYAPSGNLLLDVKGRRLPTPALRAPSISHLPILPSTRPPRHTSATWRPHQPRLENWVTHDDIHSLRHWQSLFGPAFTAAFIFIYWCPTQPPDALFDDIFTHRGLWYALRAVTVADYSAAMKVRSPKWKTFDLPGPAFDRAARASAPSLRLLAS